LAQLLVFRIQLQVKLEVFHRFLEVPLFRRMIGLREIIPSPFRDVEDTLLGGVYDGPHPFLEDCVDEGEDEEEDEDGADETVKRGLSGSLESFHSEEGEAEKDADIERGMIASMQSPIVVRKIHFV
jgi:hypothetical protein